MKQVPHTEEPQIFGSGVLAHGICAPIFLFLCRRVRNRKNACTMSVWSPLLGF